MAKDDELSKDMGKAFDKALKSSELTKKIIKQTGLSVKQMSDFALEYAEHLERAKKTTAEVTDTSKALAKAMQTMVDESGKINENYAALGVKSEQYLKLAEESKQVHKEIAEGLSGSAVAQEFNTKALESQDDMLRNQVLAQRSLVKLQTAKSTGLRGDALSAAANYNTMLQMGEITQEQYDTIIDQLREQQKITQELEDQMEMEEEIARTKLEYANQTENYKKKLQGVLATAKAIGNDPAAMGGLALTKVIGLAGDAYEGFEELRESGMSAGQALDASFKTFSFNAMIGMSDTKGAVKGLVEEFGTVNNVSAETIDNIGTVAHEMGISGDEAGKLVAQMSQMAGESTEVAAETLNYTNELAKANGIAPGKITKEMAANTKDMHLFTKGGSKEFAKIAVEAHKIGVEMSTAAKMSNQLLDFESSIEKEMEASVLLGKELNFDKARQLALEGKSVEAAKEIVNQLGGINEFNNMNVLQQQQAAEAAGMTVDELKKALDAKENGGKLSEENASQESEHAGHMLEMAAKLGSVLKNNGMLMLSMLQFLIQGGVQKTIQYAKDTAHWAKEKAHMLWKRVTGQADAASGAAKGAGDAAKSMLKKDGTPDMRFKANKKAMEAADGGADKGKKLSDKASKTKKPGGFKRAMKSIREGIQEFAKQPGKTLKGAAVLAAAGVIMAIGLAAIMKAMTVVGGPLEMIAAGVALVAFAFSFSLMAKTLGKINVGSILQGSIALVVLGAALITAALAFSLLKGVDVGAMVAFAIVLPLLALAAAGLGFLAPYIAVGALALAILGAALIPAALAFKLLGDVDVGMIVNFAGSLLILAGAAAIMGMMVIPLMLGSIALGILSGALVVLGVGLMAITAGMEGMNALITFFQNMAETGAQVMVGLVNTAFGMITFAGALMVLAFAAFFGTPALIALGAGMMLLGTGVMFAAVGLQIISEALPAIADGVGALGKTVGVLGLASLYLMELGLAALIAAPGMIIGSFALGMLAATMGMFAAAVTLAIPGVALLVQLGSMADAFASIAASLWSMAAGIAAFATAGLLTLPTIMGLIALSFVAPILTLLGDSINYDLNGGSSVEQAPEESEMKILIEEVRALRAAFQTPGVINMDGQKVGDVLGLAVSDSGVI